MAESQVTQRESVTTIFHEYLQRIGVMPSAIQSLTLQRGTEDLITLQTFLWGQFEVMQVTGLYHNGTLEWVLVQQGDEGIVPIWRHGFFFNQEA